MENSKRDEYDHYRGFCPECRTIIDDIALWREDGPTRGHVVNDGLYCPYCGAKLLPTPVILHIEGWF